MAQQKHLKVVVVVGNPKPASRTRMIAEMLVEKLLDPGSFAVDVIELAAYTQEIFSWSSEPMDKLKAQVVQSDLVVFATPTYKATYTGLLKCFLDQFQANALAGVTAIPLHTGGDLSHSMSPTFTLSPLLAELGAIVPGRGFFLPFTQLEEVDKLVEKAAAEYSLNIKRVANIAWASGNRLPSGN